MQCYCGTDTSSTVDIHGLLDTRGDTDALEESVSTGCLSKPTMNARDTANVINHGSTAIIELLHEIAQMW